MNKTAPGRIRKSLKVTATVISVVLVYDFFYLMMFNILHFDNFYPGDTWRNDIPLFINNLVPISVLLICNLLIVSAKWKGTVIGRRLSLKITTDAVISFIVLYLVNITYVFVAEHTGLNPKVEWPGTILCNTLLLMGVEIFYYVKRSKAAVIQSEKNKREAMQYRYDALKSQVNPHFLFNSLSILYSLITIDQTKASKFTLMLSDIYRYVMRIRDKSLVPLSDEMEFIHTYIEILKVRFGEAFQVETVNESSAEEGLLIPYSLQLLVENVTKHNIITKDEPVKVTIAVSATAVTISNTLNPKDKTQNTDSVSGFGLKYLAGQYGMYGRQMDVNNNGKTFTVTIPILWKEQTI